MKAKESLFLLLSGITAFTVLMTGCVKQPDYSGPDDNGQGGGNGFDYATVADVKINVDYSMKGNKAVFEVFAENPVIEKDGLLVRKEGVKSLLKAYTDRDSKYSGVVNLPTAARKVWLYSESYGLPICIEAEVTTAGISGRPADDLRIVGSGECREISRRTGFIDPRRFGKQSVQYPATRQVDMERTAALYYRRDF